MPKYVVTLKTYSAPRFILNQMTQSLIKGTSLSNTPLEELKLNSDMVPSFLPSVCKLISDCSTREGIFRRSGCHLLLKNLNVLFFHPDACLPPSATVDDAAVFLKQWLLALPEPVVSPELVNTFLKRDEPDSVRIVLQNMSVTSRRTLALIFSTVRDVLAQSAVNKMTWGNVAFCFFGAVTHGSKGVTAFERFPCHYFYMNAVTLLNDDGTDFNLDDPIPADRATPFDDRQETAVETNSLVRRIQQAIEE